MIQPLDERTPPMTPQLALRVAIIGTVALVLFGVIFFRLWFLQVLSGDQYVAQARGNTTRSIPVAAPRGQILASNGTALVESQEVPAVEIDPEDLPVPLDLGYIERYLEKTPVSQPRADYAVYDELAKLLGMSTKPQRCHLVFYLGGPPKNRYPELARIPCLVAQGIANSQYAPVTIKTDVSTDVSYYIQERQTESQFEGVVGDAEVYLRQYPYGKQGLAAQVLGYVGLLNPADKGDPNYAGAKDDDVVGQDGLELEYNRWLMGTDGEDRVTVNAANEFEGNAKEIAPQAGDNLKTSLNISLEEVGEKALAHSIAATPGAQGGAFVAMDPANGQVYAMGSEPTYDPSDFVPSISTKEYDKLTAASANEPLINRAISSPLPDGSTFKVITATAALETGLWGIDEPYDDTGHFCYPGISTSLPGSCIQNSGGSANGYTTLETAIQISDDVYFYHLGYLLYQRELSIKNPNDWPLQKWAKAFGIGQATGIDLPGESSGTLPTPAYLKARYKEEIECEDATGEYAYSNDQGQISATPKPGYHRSPKYPASKGGCGISNYELSIWDPGDTVEMGVGQGDDQVTPMQLAVVYAAIENGGKIVTPHIGEAIESPTNGTILQRIDPAVKRTLDINATDLDAIRQGLHEAAQTPSGTSYDVMGSLPFPVYGKTGTAELGDSASSPEDAWYACYVPSKTKPIVVVVSVEKGGFGDVGAAPVAREILSQWYLGKPGQFATGSADDNAT